MHNFHTNNCLKTDGAYNHFTTETNRNLTENTEILWVKLMISVFSGFFRFFRCNKLVSSAYKSFLF